MGLQELKSFSERKGITKPRTKIQVDSMDDVLRNRLWNVLDFYYWRRGSTLFRDTSPEMKSFLNKLMHNFFKLPVDTLSFMWDEDYDYLRKSFFSFPWHAVYDFIEFVANNYQEATIRDSFIKTCNDVLERELSAYRFVGGQITQITSKEEISEIEEALDTPLKSVHAHLDNALKLLSDKKSPDFRNSIKESISAVEAICRLITKKKNATLGDALDIIEKEDKNRITWSTKESIRQFVWLHK